MLLKLATRLSTYLTYSDYLTLLCVTKIYKLLLCQLM